MEVIIAPKARSDITSILAWSEATFGSQTARRYGRLIATAITQVAENPDLLGACQRPELANNCRTYHLLFSRKSAGRVGDRIRRPCHFLLYRVTEAGAVEIARVFHESMDLTAHLPEAYRRSLEWGLSSNSTESSCVLFPAPVSFPFLG
jgi:toxin ParE1/3/4